MKTAPLQESLEMHPQILIKVFRSAGGLLVMSACDSQGVDLGYSESPFFKEALRILNDDIQAGGREYKEVYGPIETHYLTGSPGKRSIEAINEVMQGGRLYMQLEKDSTTLVVESLCRTPYDEFISKEEIDEKGSAQGTWRGITYEGRVFIFPNGDHGYSYRVVDNPENKSCDMYEVHKTLTGEDFWNTLEKVSDAEPVETNNETPKVFGIY